MNTNRITIIGGSVLIVVILVVGYLIGISPQLAEADVSLSQQQVVDADNVAQQAAADLLKAKFANIGPLRADYAALQTEIPMSLNSPDLVDQVKALADGAGVVILAIKIGQPQAMVPPAAPTKPAPTTPANSATPAASAASVTPAAAAAAALTGRLYFSTVEITLGGSSVSVFNFVNALQEGKRLFMSNKVVVTSGGTTPGGTISGSVLIVPPTTVVAAK